MRKALRRLKGYTGRVLRDIERQLNRVPEGALESRLVEVIGLVNRLLAQKPKDKKKLYSLHEPAVDCISKGKAHKRYEFGTKVSVATTNRGGFVVGMRALPGTPYDGHTLSEALEQVEILTDQRPEMAFVDRGYRGHGVEQLRRFHQRGAARRDQDNSRTATAQRYRTNDRPHEERWSPDAMSAQRDRGRCALRGALRLRP